MQKADLKPLLGVEAYVCKEDASIKNERNKHNSHLCIIAKNDEGWRDMVEMVSKSNDKEFFYYKPRLDLNRILEFASRGNLMAFSGHINSNIANSLYDDNKDLSVNWRKSATHMAEAFKDAFGENFFLEVQLMDVEACPQQKEIADCVRQISKDTGIPCVASQDAHYARKEDAIDQRILLCTNLNTTLQQANRPEFGMGAFFRSQQYHIPSYDEMKQWHTDEELENTLLFASQVEKYSKILRSPILPKFPCPNGMSPDEYLRQKCREGWKQKIQNRVSKDRHKEYGERVEHELQVLQGAGLSSYFLIVADILEYVRSNGWLPSPGRGSASGCMVSYLCGITGIDPIPYGLIFSRFYNSGRNVDGHISMPDIDVDVPKYAREKVIDYIRQKYGKDHVGQMVTFQTMKGRGAIKNVLRAHGGMTFFEMNEVSKPIIEEHKITDELQKMKEETGDSSIIRWCLEYTPEKLEQWCRIDDNGKFSGPLASRFEQAIRLEGTKTVQSKHAAGIVVTPEPLHKMCPIITDKESGDKLAAFEMNCLEASGGLKLDILGITNLDKSMGAAQDLLRGEIHEI